VESHIQAVLAAMTPQIYESFKRAIELRKWPDGRVLSEQQLRTCMEAVIAYEHHHVPLEQRTGYVPPKEEACEDESHIHTRETPLVWRD
jgi:uncharacterized protein YeaC (DUF1315 family)